MSWGERLRRAKEADPVAFRVRAALTILLVATALRLVIGDDPWTGGVAERLADGKNVRPVDYARTFGWWSAAVATPILALLLASVGRWLQPGPPPVAEELTSPGRPDRVFAVALAALVLVGAWYAAPRLSYSLFEDERYNVQWSIDGYYYRDKRGTGELRRHEPTWRDALWHYEWPNNHVPNTLLSRWSLGAWRLATQPDHRMVNETALRTPAFLFGLASIAAIALLAWRLGHPGAGLAAAALLALHPWHVRYMSECRGYSLVLLLLSLLPLLLVRALHRGSWGRWAAFGAAELVIMWTYPSAGFFLVFLNAAALFWLWRRYRGSEHLVPQLQRLVLAGVGAALAWYRLMAPNLAQLRIYLQELNTEDEMNAAWFRDVGSFATAGMPWGRIGENPRYSELSDRAMAHPELVWTFVALLCALVVVGAASWIVAGGLRRILVPVLVLPPLVVMGWVYQSGGFIHPHYMVVALPGLALLAGVGIEGLARLPLRPLGIAAAAAALLSFAAFTHVPRSELRARPIQPWRDSVLATRPSIDPLDPANAEILTASFNFPSVYYDALGYRLRRPEELLVLVEEADRSGRPLFVNLGRPKLARRKMPELMAIVDERFEPAGSFEGLLSRGYREVYRYGDEGDG